MTNNHRIDDLRRRVHRDPASIAFAQLAEECRRAGQHEESVEVCRAGLAIHPGYLSARVTLGRALIELDHLDEAQAALDVVLKSAPENLAAIRGLAEIHHRRGLLPEALAQYRAALALARNDPDLQRTVAELARKVEPRKPPPSADGLSFEPVQSEFLMHSPPPVVRLKPDTAAVRLKPDATSTTSAPDATSALKPDATSATSAPDATSVLKPDATSATSALNPDVTSTPRLDAIAEGRLKPDIPDTVEVDLRRLSADAFDFLQPGHDSAQVGQALSLQSGEDTATRELAMQTIAALERWLDAIHVTRAQRIA